MSEAIKQSGTQRAVERVGQTTIATTRKTGDTGVFLKLPKDWSGGPEYPFSQYLGYEQIAPYLRTPRVRLLDGKGRPESRIVNGKYQYLAVEPVTGERFDQALIAHPDKFTRAAGKFIADQTNMWQSTKKRVEDLDDYIIKSTYAILRKPTVDTINAFLKSEESQGLLDLPLVINGEKYPSIREISTSCVAHTQEHREPVLTTIHGDENIWNLFLDEEMDEISYKIIDPRREPYPRSPAWAVNTFIGTSLLFGIDYNIQSQVRGDSQGSNVLEINYGITPQHRDAAGRILDCGREMVQSLHALDEGEFATREYLFANILRGAIRRVAPKNQEKVKKNKFAYLAMAAQEYTDFDGFLQGKYFGLGKSD